MLPLLIYSCAERGNSATERVRSERAIVDYWRRMTSKLWNIDTGDGIICTTDVRGI